MSAHGRWRITIDTPVGEKTALLELAVQGPTLSGSLAHAEHVAPISDGRVDGNRLTWSAKLTTPMNLTIKFVATVEADRIEGRAKYLLGSAAFRGVRVTEGSG